MEEIKKSNIATNCFEDEALTKYHDGSDIRVNSGKMIA